MQATLPLAAAGQVSAGPAGPDSLDRETSWARTRAGNSTRAKNKTRTKTRARTRARTGARTRARTGARTGARTRARTRVGTGASH